MRQTLLLFLFCVVLAFSQDTCSNYGLAFDGKNGFQSAGDWHVLQEFTLEFWVLFDEPAMNPEGVVQAFIVKGATSCDIDGYGFFRSNRTLYFIMADTGICGDNTMQTELKLDEWTHVAVAVRNNDAVLYVNGQVAQTKTKTNQIRFGTVTAPMRIGQGPDPDSGFMTGQLDEIRFWNVFRSQNQINSYYDKSLTKNQITEDLFGYWRFEEGTDTFVVDSSNYDRDTIVLGTLDYVPNCEVAACICGEAFCIPGMDRTNTAQECPETSSSTTRTSSTVPTTTRTTASSSSTSSTTSTTKPDSNIDTEVFTTWFVISEQEEETEEPNQNLSPSYLFQLVTALLALTLI